jgi:hypothetical protein
MKEGRKGGRRELYLEKGKKEGRFVHLCIHTHTHI